MESLKSMLCTEYATRYISVVYVRDKVCLVSCVYICVVCVRVRVRARVCTCVCLLLLDWPNKSIEGVLLVGFLSRRFC